jgi:hypothetical protein
MRALLSAPALEGTTGTGWIMTADQGAKRFQDFQPDSKIFGAIQPFSAR